MALHEAAGHSRASDVERPHVATIQGAALAEHAIEDGAARLDEAHRLAALVDDVESSGGDRGDPEISIGVYLEPVGNVAVRHLVDHGHPAVGPAADDIHRIGLDPDERARGLRHHPLPHTLTPL